MLGFLQCWFTELIDSPSRWRYLIRDWTFVALFFASGIVFSILSDFPGLDDSLSEDGNEASLFFSITLGVVAVWLGYVLVWHIVYSKKTLRTTRDFSAFWLFRACTIAALGLAYYVIHSESPSPPDGPAKLHLHHYFIAWLASMIAAFNHPISAGFLAITSGIFVQGISVYSAASLFYRGDHDTPCPEVRIY